MLRHGRALLLGGLLAVALVPAAQSAASAADPTPAPTPTQASSPGLSPPSQQQIDDAKDALERLRHHRTSRTPATTLSDVAGPVAGPSRPALTARISDQAWWTIGAGVLVLVVLSETTRLRVRRAKHRKGSG